MSRGNSGIGVLLFVFFAAAAARCGWEVAAPAHASAIKRDPELELELERLRSDLRLRNAELLVCRGQLKACRNHCRGVEE